MNRAISTVADINPGLKKHPTKNEIISFIPMAGVSESGRLLFQDEKTWSQVDSGFTYFQDQDVLFAKITPCMENGKGALVTKLRNGIGAGSTEFHVIRAKDEGSPEFIHQILQSSSFRAKAEMQMTGSAGQRRVPTSFFFEHETFIPDLKFQKKIAQILSTCDAVIEKTEEVIAKYQAIKQGMMHDLFTCGIDLTTGKLRPKYEDASELYKESELGMIPKEWESCKMGKYIVRNLYGPRFSANDYSIDGNVKTIRGMDFTKDGEILYDQAPIASLPNSKIFPHILKAGDVVIVTTADCGLTAVFEDQNFHFIPSAYSVKYRFDEKVNPYFIKFLMKTDTALRQVNKYVRQGTLGNLPGSDLLKFNVNIPDLKEQTIIVGRLMSIERRIESEQSILSKYQQIKAGLMQDLLTGKVEVTINEN